MEELIQVVFFAVIILASVAEGAARKRKEARKRAEQGSRAEQASRAETAYTEPDAELTTWRSGSHAEDQGPGIRGASQGERAESMIPPDLWEEIAALARGETPEPDPPLVPEPPQVPEPVLARKPPSAWEASRTGSRVSQTPDAASLARGSDWDESESKQWGRIETSEEGASHSHAITHPHQLSAVPSVKVVHSRGGRVLPLGDRRALRQAFLLKEVLSSPRGMAAPGRLPMEDD